MSKTRNPDALIRIEDAIKVLCRKTCHPGVLCPDSYCVEMWDEFEDVERVDAVSVRHGRWTIEDATENARFDISKFPADMLLTLRDATTDKLICWHYCLRFDSPDEGVQFRYFDMLKRAMFKEKDGEQE